jgi:lysozyme family protein
MADFAPAVALTLQHEGGFFHNSVTGEVVNRGITLAFVRDCGYNPTADEAFIQNLTLDQTSDIYRKYFWDRYNIGAIADQNLANKVFDLTVNMGPGGSAHDGALTLLQKAVNDCGGHCAVDGIIGPQSIAQINAENPVQLLAAYRARAGERYREIATADPNVAGDLNGWLARLHA